MRAACRATRGSPNWPSVSSGVGPATIRDFVWWSAGDRRCQARGRDDRAKRQDVDGHAYWTAGAAPKTLASIKLAHLLPIYDEYIVSYRDRVAVPTVRR